MTLFNWTTGIRWTGAQRVALTLLVLACAGVAQAQEGTTIPPGYIGTQDAVARGVLDGNLLETNFRNHGEYSRWNDIPWGVYPRTIGGRHIDGIGVVVAGLVRGERAKWAGPPYNFWPAGTPDTLLNPVAINYRDAGKKVGPNGELWGWLPLPGFHNELRRNPQTQQREPTPALSDDPASWPAMWPDRLTEQDAGWPGEWNGMFGKGVFSADLEAYYVMDDLSDKEYHIDKTRGRPYSNYGVFYPDPADSSRGGMGLQVAVRTLQWANVLAEDATFLIYRITNIGQTNYGEIINLPQGPTKTGLYFAQFVDYGLGNEEGDEMAAFDPLLDVVYGWDIDGIGQHQTGGTYKLSYTGFAFLESPANDSDGLDNDEDGMTDESRFSGPGMRIEGQENIRAYAAGRYNMANFERYYGRIEDRPAFRAGVWWTGDENMDWVGFADANNNGQYDPGELVNDDYGRDGLGPFDLGYPGPDAGEADGIPTIREPNFDENDVDESDQIGLTGFELSARPVFESGDNLRDDTWMWDRIKRSQFELGTKPASRLANVEPFFSFSSGPVTLGPNKTDFFSTAWVFGANLPDFLNNLQTVQRIYNADYRFAQPPIPPTLAATAGDGYVILSWDALSLQSYDRFTQEFDFEGFKLYKGTDPLLSDAKLVTDWKGNATFYRPIAQWDLKNTIQGSRPVMENTALYDLGSNTGLEFSFIDRDVKNGKTYYYALVAYDRGFEPGPDSTDPNASPIDPQENTFSIAVDQGGTVRGHSSNVAIVVPRARAAGWQEAGANEDLSTVTEGIGTGSVSVMVVNPSQLVEGSVYEISFFDTTQAGYDMYSTTGYLLRNATTNEVLIPRSPLVDRTPSTEGFTIAIENNEPSIDLAKTGWKASNGNGGFEYNRDPSRLPGYSTDWVVTIREDDTGRHVPAPYEYELTWSDSMYTTPVRPRGFLSGKQIPLQCRNVTLGQRCDIIVQDLNGNTEVDYLADAFIISDEVSNVARFRQVVTFQSASGGSTLPATGSTVRVSTNRPFAEGDLFRFTLRDGMTDPDMARGELDAIRVVPNPYVVAAEWEPRTQISGRGGRLIQFTHLPATCTIKIYTIRGELVRTLEHDGLNGDGAAWWDLKSQDNQEVAYGIYLYHINAPGIGEKTGKFAIVK